jgi:hypothetical protein
MENNRLVLEVINAWPSGKKAFFFSRPFFKWQHHSDVTDKELATLVRSFLQDHIDGEIIIRNSISAKELYSAFKNCSG